MRWFTAALVPLLGLSSSAARAFERCSHDLATHAALEGMTPDALQRVDAGNEHQDAPCSLSLGRDAHHFNDCGFAPAAEYIRAQYIEIDEALGTTQPRAALTAFGRILHAVQDFYSHSNWADSNLQGLVTDASDAPKPSPDWPLMPSGVFGEVVLVDTELEGWTLTRTGRKVTATPATGAARTALITGAVAVGTSCPLSVVLGHWDSPGEKGGLAKDEPGRPNYARALDAATRQSRREVCRLYTRTASSPARKASVQSWFTPTGYEALVQHCAASWWQVSEQPSSSEDSSPPGTERSVYTAWELGSTAGARLNLDSSSELLALDGRWQHWGFALRHGSQDPISVSGTWAPFGRVAGIFVELGGGISVWPPAGDCRPVALGALSYDWSPWANILGVPIALHTRASVLIPRSEFELSRALSFDLGVRFGLPL